MDVRTKLINKLVNRAEEDSLFRSKLLSDPKAAIEEETGYKLPSNLKINVLEEKHNEYFLVLPYSEPSGGELSDAELENVAGGWTDVAC